MNESARTFIFVGLVVVILMAMHLLPPLFVGDVELRKVNILSDVLPEADCTRDAIDLIPALDPPKPIHSLDDTAKQQPALQKEMLSDITLIDDYGQGQSHGMAHFYSQLLHIEELGRPLRIAYFGDSFIEGDILTCDLREQLQTRHGGCGVGWVDCGSQVSGFRQTVRHDFHGIEEHEVVRRPFNHQAEGISQRYFVAEEGASMRFKGSRCRKHLSKWQEATFFFRTSGELQLSISVNGDSATSETIASDESPLQVVRRKCPSMSSIHYSVDSITPDTYLYGVALEGEKGIVVDNFSMRGSSGTSLYDIPMATLEAFAAKRPYDLIIMQFGLNVVSEKSEAANYSAYTKKMGNAIMHLGNAFPQASLLVVSIPDRDQRTDAGIRTMFGVESLVAYQQIMAAQKQVAFFNMFKAMGGRESMKALVDKGLANKDYTHLSFSGGRQLATCLVKSLEAGFEDYKQNHP